MLFLFNPPSRGMCDTPVDQHGQMSVRFVEGEPALCWMIAWKATLTVAPQTEPQFAKNI